MKEARERGTDSSGRRSSAAPVLAAMLGICVARRPRAWDARRRGSTDAR